MATKTRSGRQAKSVGLQGCPEQRLQPVLLTDTGAGEKFETRGDAGSTSYPCRCAIGGHCSQLVKVT